MPTAPGQERDWQLLIWLIQTQVASKITIPFKSAALFPALLLFSTEWVSYHFDLITKWYVRVCVCVCQGREGRETMRTEIRGYLFSIRMFQVRQASDEGNRGTNKRRRRSREEEALLQLVCYISQYLGWKHLCSRKNLKMYPLSRETHTRTARGNQPSTGQIHFEASVRATWGLILISYFVE